MRIFTLATARVLLAAGTAAAQQVMVPTFTNPADYTIPLVKWVATAVDTEP